MALDSTSKTVLAAMPRRSVRLPARPRVLAEVASALEDPAAGATRLATLVRGDPALSARVLRLANSSAWRGRRRIESVQQAIARMGMRRLRELVLTAGMVDVFHAPGYEAMATGLWEHALATAFYANEVARVSQRQDDAVFLCGLLHSIGKMAVLFDAARVAARLKVSLSADGMDAIIAERHELVAVELSREWDLPDVVRATIVWVEAPGLATRHQACVHTVSLAALLARLVMEGEVGAVQASVATREVLGLDPTRLDDIAAAGPRVREAVEALTA